MSDKTRMTTSSKKTAVSSNPPGWEQLDGLARKPTLLVLQDGRLLEIAGARTYIFRVQPAADGTYHLKRSGQLGVRQGILQEVVGAPFTEAIYSAAP